MRRNGPDRPRRRSRRARDADGGGASSRSVTLEPDPRYALPEPALPPEGSVPSPLAVARIHLQGEAIERGAPGIEPIDA